MNNRSDMNRMASMMGKVKSGPYMMGNEPTKKEIRATKKSMKETAKSTPAKMPVKTPTSVKDSYETGNNIMHRADPVNYNRPVIKAETNLYHPDDAQFYTKAGISDARWGEMQQRNRDHVDKYNIGKLSNFGETVPETKTFAEFKKYELERMRLQNRNTIAPDKMYNHSTGKKQPTGREVHDDRRAKYNAELHTEAKAIMKQWEEQARLRKMGYK